MSKVTYSRGPGSLTGFLMMLMGFFVMAIAFGVIPTNPSSIHAPGWLLAVFGGAFVVAGLWAIFVRAIRQDTTEAGWANFLFALTVMVAISIICLWIGFGPGQRFFAANDSLTGMRTSLITDPSWGRIFLGFFGILMAVVTVAFTIIQGRKLL